jgi:membrane-associated phospholipid phosphatase
LTALLESVRVWDSAASTFGESVRWEPLTFVLLLASAWWVKWPLIAMLGVAGDCRRRCLPRATVAAFCAVAAAGVSVAILKELFDRARPPASGIDAVGLIPASASFPSGHAATAFAAAVAVGAFYPRFRRPLLALAAVVALSRVYLGVHYATDVLAGSALGVLLGLASVWLVRAVAPAPTGLEPSPALAGTSFARLRRSPE